MGSSFVIQALKILSTYWKAFLNGLIWALGWTTSSTAKQGIPTSGGHLCQGDGFTLAACGIPKNASGSRSRGVPTQHEQSCCSHIQTVEMPAALGRSCPCSLGGSAVLLTIICGALLSQGFVLWFCFLHLQPHNGLWPYFLL